MKKIWQFRQNTSEMHWALLKYVPFSESALSTVLLSTRFKLYNLNTYFFTYFIFLKKFAGDFFFFIRIRPSHSVLPFFVFYAQPLRTAHTKFRGYFRKRYLLVGSLAIYRRLYHDLRSRWSTPRQSMDLGQCFFKKFFIINFYFFPFLISHSQFDPNWVMVIPIFNEKY